MLVLSMTRFLALVFVFEHKTFCLIFLVLEDMFHSCNISLIDVALELPILLMGFK